MTVGLLEIKCCHYGWNLKCTLAFWTNKINIPFFPFKTSVGPLHSDSLYDISASKEGFVLTPVEGNTGDFKAFALAGVTFEVNVKLTLLSHLIKYFYF